MKNALNFLEKNKIILYIISFIVIIFDLLLSYFYDDPIRLFINYLLIPGLMFFSVIKNHRSYIILLLYELFISLLTFYDIIGISIFTYFWLPDIWHIFSMFSIDATVLGLPAWLQPIFITALLALFALVLKKQFFNASERK